MTLVRTPADAARLASGRSGAVILRPVGRQEAATSTRPIPHLRGGAAGERRPRRKVGRGEAKSPHHGQVRKRRSGTNVRMAAPAASRGGKEKKNSGGDDGRKRNDSAVAAIAREVNQLTSEGSDEVRRALKKMVRGGRDVDEVSDVSFACHTSKAVERGAPQPMTDAQRYPEWI